MAKLDMLMEKTEAAAATAMKPSGCNDNPEDPEDSFDFNSSVFVPVVEEDSFEGPSTTSNGRVLHDATRRKQVNLQLKRRTVTVGYHHGWFNSLTSTWQFPNGFTVIQLINMWLVGNPRENVPPLG